MKHRIHQRKLNRTSEHRRALLRNMAQNLIEHGQITTTLPKAKALRPFVERLVTLAVKTRKLAAEEDAAGSLRARRRIHVMLSDRSLIPDDHRSDYEGMSDARRAKTMRTPSGRRHRAGDPKGRLAFTGESVTRRLIERVAPRYLDRPGGYTRLVRLAERRVGDAAPKAILQLVGEEQAPVSITKPGKLARHRRSDARYAMAVKAARRWKDKNRPVEVGAGPRDDRPSDTSGEAASSQVEGEPPAGETDPKES